MLGYMRKEIRRLSIKARSLNTVADFCIRFQNTEFGYHQIWQNCIVGFGKWVRLSYFFNVHKIPSDVHKWYFEWVQMALWWRESNMYSKILNFAFHTFKVSTKFFALKECTCNFSLPLSRLKEGHLEKCFNIQPNTPILSFYFTLR